MGTLAMTKIWFEWIYFITSNPWSMLSSARYFESKKYCDILFEHAFANFNQPSFPCTTITSNHLLAALLLLYLNKRKERPQFYSRQLREKLKAAGCGNCLRKATNWYFSQKKGIYPMCERDQKRKSYLDILVRQSM